MQRPIQDTVNSKILSESSSDAHFLDSLSMQNVSSNFIDVHRSCKTRNDTG